MSLLKFWNKNIVDEHKYVIKYAIFLLLIDSYSVYHQLFFQRYY